MARFQNAQYLEPGVRQPGSGDGGELAASLNRYEFLLTAALLLKRGTGSSIDPMRCSEVLKPAKEAARKPRRATA